MNGLSLGKSKYSAARSARIEGAKGRKLSRNLIFRFTRCQLSAFLASARMARFQRDLGPNSILPWNQPTTFCSRRYLETRLKSSVSPYVSCGTPVLSRYSAISASPHSGPQKTWGISVGFLRGFPNTWYQAWRAAPADHPASQAAGNTHASLKIPSSNNREFAAQLSADPPARQTFDFLVISFAWRQTARSASSKTF